MNYAVNEGKRCGVCNGVLWMSDILLLLVINLHVILVKFLLLLLLCFYTFMLVSVLTF